VRIALFALVFLLLAGCKEETSNSTTETVTVISVVAVLDAAPRGYVISHITPLNTFVIVGAATSVNATVETRDGAAIGGYRWYLAAGPSSKMIIYSPWARATTMVFFEPGVYDVAFEVSWQDTKGAWRYTTRYLTFHVHGELTG
jgi:hypothetical protein